MPTKIGSIQSLRRTGAKFVELLLDNGDKVELPHMLWDYVQINYRPDDVLVFVERRGRIFRFVQWVGTVHEAREAVGNGTLSEDEVPADVISGPTTESSPDWTEMAQRSVLALIQSSREGDHAAVGQWLDRLQAIALRAPFPDLAVYVQMLGGAEDPTLKQQGLEGIMAWVKASMGD